MLEVFKKLLKRYQRLGITRHDSLSLRQKKAVLVVIPLVIGFAALVWASIYIIFGYYYTALIPLSYILISAYSLLNFSHSKNIVPLVNVQLILILVLPFLLMWSLGGFNGGSFMIIWAFYAPIGSLIYQSSRHALWWLMGFFGMTIISLLIDQSPLLTAIEPMPTWAIELLFVLNISAGPIGLFLLIRYFVDDNERKANSKLQQEHEALLERTEQLNEAHEELKALAHRDPLTQLANRTQLSHRIEQLITHSNWERNKFAVIFIDLDNFKQINDTYGHTIGDQTLLIASKRLTRITRPSDFIARFGGDEFVLIAKLDDYTSEADNIAKRILEAFSSAFEIEDIMIHITPSIGIAMYPDHGVSSDSLLKKADTAMYRAKNQGRNSFSYYSEQLTTDVMLNMQIESMLLNALERDEFSLQYQVQVDTSNQRVYGIEVLLRWAPEGKSNIPPNVFIPIAENSGLIYPIGRWVLEQACQFMATLVERGHDITHIAVNVSGIQFIHDNFIADVDAILEATGLDSRYLELELTESVIMNDHAQTINNLQTLSDRGITLSIDDFGTGYSSLSYLKRLPIDTIKIDRSFIRDISHDDEDKAIVESIIALGQALNLKIIAEGVEDLEQLDYLSSRQCHLIQGYLFSRPLDQDDLLALLEQTDSLFDKLTAAQGTLAL